MTEPSFFWHDYETFGVNPRRDRPAQFAGVRTDMALNEIEAPVMHYCRPAPDFLPEPEACVLTGILPQTCLEKGLREAAFADTVHAQLAQPGTVGVGYNSIRFDDEVTRFLFWRNLLDPYAREWQNECGRWDLLDAMRCAYALRPGGIEWPQHADGKVSFRLEDLARANGLVHETAHDALSDVRATIALARRLKSGQPKLWDFCLRLRKKNEVLKEMALAQDQGLPFLHVSGRYGVERGCIAVVWPLAPHPTNKNEVIVWDLSADPSELFTLGTKAIRERLFSAPDALPPGVVRLPIKTIHLNKSPIVIGNLNTLAPPMAAKWQIDVDQARRHAEVAARRAGSMAGIWPAVYERDASDGDIDVDEDLYGAFIGDEDRRSLQRLRALPAAQLVSKRPALADPRLEELLFRFRARNFSASLDPADRKRWVHHCARRLHEGASGAMTLAAFQGRVDALGHGADERCRKILGALLDYAQAIAPPR
ncbi:MAG: exodeoxyribonuclease I [Burkholderiaceae bacterium]